MLTLSTFGVVAAQVPPASIHASVDGWGKVGRTRGDASLTIGFGTLDGHQGVQYVIIEVCDSVYGWQVTKVKQCRNVLIVHATSLGGHEAADVMPGPGRLTVIVKGHGSDCSWVLAAGRKTLFMAR